MRPSFISVATGVRRRSKVAALYVFLVYALGTRLAYSNLRILLCGLLLSNVRAVWLASRWRSSGTVDDSPAPLGDKLSDLFPVLVWPKTRVVFYVFAPLEIAGIALVLIQSHGH
jgi:hypothetical protein